MTFNDEIAGPTTPQSSRAASSEPCLHRRDSNEDGDVSLTRKRPRLDSGSRAARSMSADRILGQKTRYSPTTSIHEQARVCENTNTNTPSKVTINLRPQIQPIAHNASPTTNGAQTPPESASSTTPTDSMNVDVPPRLEVDEDSTSKSPEHDRSDSLLDTQKNSPSPDSAVVADSPAIESTEPAVVAVNDDDEEEEWDYLSDRESFPLYQPDSTLEQCAKLVTEFIQHSVINTDVLQQVSLWIETHLRKTASIPESWLEIYNGDWEFWDELGVGFQQLLARAKLSFSPAGSHDGLYIFHHSILSYTRLCTRLVDVDVRETESRLQQNGKRRLWSWKYVQAMCAMFDSRYASHEAILQEVSYAKTVGKLGSSSTVRMLSEFFFAPSSGIHHLATLASALATMLDSYPQFWIHLLDIVHLCSAFSQFSELVTSRLPGLMEGLNSLGSYPENAIEIFNQINSQFQQFVDKQMSVLAADTRRDLILQLGCLLRYTSSISPTVARTLSEEIMTRPESCSPELLPKLNDLIWKLKTLKQCIAKGKMEIRVLGVDIACDVLVNMWRDETNRVGRINTEDSVEHHVAQVLLDEKIINYIVGVDSHPTLIQRCGNIVGLLMVTQRLGLSEIDVIWNAIANSPDPRVVAACVEMLSGIVQLMTVPSLLYLSDKFAELRIDAFNATMVGLWRNLNSILLSSEKRMDWLLDENRMGAYHVCLKIMIDTFPGKSQTPHCKAIHSDAITELLRLVRGGQSAERQILFSQLLHDISKPSADTGAQTEVLYHILRDSPDDHLDAADRFGLSRIAISNFQNFVWSSKQSECPESESSFLLAELTPRLDLVVLLARDVPQSMPAELRQSLWDAMVGKDAISNAARDLAWFKLTDVARDQFFRHELLDTLLSGYLPSLPCEYYTSQLYTFLERAIQYQLAAQNRTYELDDQNLVTLPSEELMWSVMLNAPPGTVEEGVTKLLAAAYETLPTYSVAKSAIESKHVAVAKRCVQEMTAAAASLRHSHLDDVDTMDTEVARSPSNPDMRFRRTINLLGLLLQSIRSNPKLLSVPPPPIEQASGNDGPGSAGGDPIRVKYQAFNGHEGPVQTIELDDLETRHQLYNRLAKLTSFHTFYTILGGHKVDFLEKPLQTLRDWGKATSGLIVVKQVQDHYHGTDNMPSIGRCAMELEVLKSFDGIYALLDDDDELAGCVYDFLTKFPAHENAALQSVGLGDVNFADIFPEGKVYKTRYSIRCLSERLETQIHSDNIDPMSVEASVKLLSDALTADGKLRDDLDSFPGMTAVAELVHCLCRSLIAAPIQVEDLPKPETLISRLVAVLQKALSTPGKEELARETYDALLEACLHSLGCWSSFRSREDIEALHNSLFFAEVDVGPLPVLRKEPHYIRASVANLIREKLSRTSWNNVPQKAVAKFFWNIMVPLIPRTVEQPKRSLELFNIADCLLNLVYDHEDGSEDGSEDISESTGEDLHAYFLTWSTLLLEHTHQEYVGREECDPIVYGLAQLLNSCVQYTKIEQDAGLQFVQDIFGKFLFPRLTGDYDSLPTPPPIDQPLVPVLHSETRRKLFDLLLSLCDSCASLKQLAVLTEEALRTHGFGTQTIYYRKSMLRSPTGLVGIRNLGNTCYMNALLTQLYMNVDFRDFVLNIPIADDVSQRLLLDMQLLFSYMQEGFSKSVDATRITESVRTFDGEAIDVAVQMDVEEFENLLIDQLEGQILDSNDKQRFRSFYGGHVVNQIKSKECQHVSQRLEPYFAVQCDVKGKTNLLDSLQAFVEGDFMEGDNKYKCESCGGRFVNAVKRTCLKDVPDNLIFHLKRFDFDIGTMQRSKINDFFEFPMRIDVSPYKFEHLENPQAPIEEDCFDLVGVLLHKGVAEHGHYFSYIRSRPSESGEPPKWIQFDDADVSEFDPSEISEKCFGGWADPKNMSSNWAEEAILQKPYNGYMLFYERANKIENADVLIKQDAPSGPPKVRVPKDQADIVASENADLLRQYTAFDPVHLDFVYGIVKRATNAKREICTKNHDLERRTIPLALKHLHKVSSRTKDVTSFEKHCQVIKDMLGDCVDCHRLAWVSIAPPDIRDSNGDDAMLFDLTIRSTLARVRTAFRGLVMHIIKWLRTNANEDIYGASTSDEFDPAKNVQQRPGVAIMRFGSCMRVSMSKLWINLRSWDDFFHLLCDVASLGVGEVIALLDCDVLKTCLELLLLPNRNCHEDNVDWKNMQRLVEKRRMQQNRFIELIYLLTEPVDFSRAPIGDDIERVDDCEEEPGFSLSEREYSCLTKYLVRDRHYLAVTRMFDIWDSSQNDMRCPARILRKLMEAELLDNANLCATIRGGLEGYTTTNTQSFLDAAAVFCECCDDEDLIVNFIITYCIHLAMCPGDNVNLGLPLVRFFEQLLELDNTHFARNFLKDNALKTMHQWATSLLFDPAEDVRRSTYQLVEAKLIRPVLHDQIALVSPSRSMMVRQLAHSLSMQTNAAFERRFGKGNLYYAVAALSECRKYLQALRQSSAPEAAEAQQPDDVRLVQRIDDQRIMFESWHEEDEELVPSDDWPSEGFTENEELMEA